LADGKLFVSEEFSTADTVRKLLLFSSCVMIAGLLTMASLGVEDPVTTPRMKGVVAMIVVFGCGFASGWGPLTYVVVTEVTSLRLRDHTSRFGFAINVCFKYAKLNIRNFARS
jgi:hypothetical protein